MEAERPAATGEEAVTSETDRVLVSFPIEQNGQLFDEQLHALPIGDDLYCLDNSPFYAYGISLGDVVFAPRADGAPKFRHTVTRRGHSTYRVRLPVGHGHDAFMVHWGEFQKLGCMFEGSGANPARLYAIDVPPHTDIRAVYALLEAGEARGSWAFEEANYCSGDGREGREH